MVRPKTLIMSTFQLRIRSSPRLLDPDSVCQRRVIGNLASVGFESLAVDGVFLIGLADAGVPFMKPHHRIFFIQFAVAVALALGALVSRLADLQLKFHLTEGELGLLLAIMSSGVLCDLTCSARLVEKLGARKAAFVTVFGASIFYALIPWMPSSLMAAPLFFIAGVFTGAFEINANIETDRHEALLGYGIMSRAHGMWSVGFFLTGLAAAGLPQRACDKLLCPLSCIPSSS
jgi:hypothetical protein